MTPYSKPSSFRTGLKTDRVGRAVLLARAALTVERGLPAAAYALALAGLFITLALFQAFVILPWPLHAFILALFVTSIGLTLYYGFQKFLLPRWRDGARKLERDNALSHRPLSEADDALALGAGDAYAEALWQAHIARRLSEFPALRVGIPRPDLNRQDPYCLRYVLIGIVLLGFVWAGTQSPSRLLSAFGPGNGAEAGLDAWIDPPAYTGLAPIYLSNTKGALSVPIGATLNLRVHGATRAPGLMQWGGNPDAGFTGSNGEYASTAHMLDSGAVTVRANGRTIGNWDIKIIPDNKPSIGFAAAPTRTERDAVNFAIKASDDYGVTAVHAIIKPHGKTGKDLIVELPLSAVSAKSVSESRAVDLTAHPYAGLDVDITLVAVDALGQTGSSNTVTFRLPMRVFVNPLARALVELRQRLATADVTERGRVSQILDALTLAPDKFYPEQLGIYLSLRAAYWALKTARFDTDIEHVQDLLWQTANAIEGGGAASAAEELRRIQQELSQALMNGAPQDEIDALMQRYNEAMQRYVQALEQNPEAADSKPAPGAKELSQQDLDAMLKALQEMAKSGDRAAADQMLALLQQMLENLRVTQGSGNGQGKPSDTPQQKALRDAVQGLSGMMGKQRQLMDRAFRSEQGNPAPGDTPQGLAREQGQLQQDLNKLMQDMQKQGQKAPGALGKAGKAMGDAQQNLGQNDMQSAGGNQKDALDQLRQSAEDLAKQMLDNAGKTGPGANGKEDPLGRAQGDNGAGQNVKVPTQSDLQRARSILEELRKRAAERGRPQEELDYIDRLLKQF